jgi:hypothetical protein
MLLTRTLLALFLLSCLSCASAAKNTESTTPKAETVDESDADTSASEGPPEVETPDCSDGTCFPCGAGICPKGAYCDSSAASGPACAWLAECAEQPTCKCIAKTLGAKCDCNDSGAGPLVSCQ